MMLPDLADFFALHAFAFGFSFMVACSEAGAIVLQRTLPILRRKSAHEAEHSTLYSATKRALATCAFKCGGRWRRGAVGASCACQLQTREQSSAKVQAPTQMRGTWQHAAVKSIELKCRHL
jgi:hypothetical protein